VRRSVETLVTGDEAVRASVVRAKARDLLGRDSESLSDRNFPRILKDAHDNDVIDLRRRGDDFEIARAVEADSVSDQLAKTAIANAPAPAATSPVPRGMGPRGVSAPRGGRGGRPGAPPADLLSIGVVRPAATLAPAPVLPSSVPVAAPSPAAPAAFAAPLATKAAKPRAKRAAKKTAGARSENGGARAPVADVIAPAEKKTAAKKPRAKKVATATSKG